MFSLKNNCASFGEWLIHILSPLILSLNGFHHSSTRQIPFFERGLMAKSGSYYIGLDVCLAVSKKWFWLTIGNIMERSSKHVYHIFPFYQRNEIATYQVRNVL